MGAVKSKVVENQDYLYYKRAMEFYKNIHPNQLYKTNPDKTFEPKNCEEQKTILNNIFDSFNHAGYYFAKLVAEYPQSEWASDAKAKIKLLKKLYKSYENINANENTQIIDSNKFVEEIGLEVM